MSQLLKLSLVVVLGAGGTLPEVIIAIQSAPPTSESALFPTAGPELGAWVDDFDSFDAARWYRSAGSYTPFWSINGLSGTWNPANVTVDNGHLVLKTSVQERVVSAAEVHTYHKLGYGTYEAAVMVPSLNGLISAMSSYVNDSQTEINFEFEGRDPRALHTVTWTSSIIKQHEVHAHTSDYSNVWTVLKYEWLPTGVKFYRDNVLVAHHQDVVPSAPAHLIFNLWPTNNAEWGGLSTNGTALMRVDWLKFTPAAITAAVPSSP